MTRPVARTDGEWRRVRGAKPGDSSVNAFERDHVVSYLKLCAAWEQERDYVALGSGARSAELLPQVVERNEGAVALHSPEIPSGLSLVAADSDCGG